MSYLLLLLFLVIMVVFAFLSSGQTMSKKPNVYIPGVKYNYKNVQECVIKIMADDSETGSYADSHVSVCSNCSNFSLPLSLMNVYPQMADLYNWCRASGYSSYRIIKFNKSHQWSGKISGDVMLIGFGTIEICIKKERFPLPRNFLVKSKYEVFNMENSPAHLLEIYKPVAENDLFPVISFFTKTTDKSLEELNKKFPQTADRFKWRDIILKYVADDWIEIEGDPLSNSVTTWLSSKTPGSISSDGVTFLKNLGETEIRNSYDEIAYMSGKKLNLIINLYKDHDYGQLIEAIKECKKINSVLVAGGQLEALGEPQKLEENLYLYSFAKSSLTEN